MANVTFKGAPVRLSGSLPEVGSKAPGYDLYDPKLAAVTPATHSGKTKILTLNPSIDTGVCAKTTKTFNEKASSVPNAVVLAVSADLPFALRRWCGAEGVENVVALSTYRDPGFGERWGLRMEEGALASLLARAVIVIDGQDVVRYVELVPEITQEPDYEKALAAAKG
jgi:thiol peroxidase